MTEATTDAMEQDDGPGPNRTLYIKNLPEKLSRAHRLEELKGRLKLLFKPYGEILDIVALSNYYDKGQAFIIFKEIEMAEAARSKLQGVQLEGKEMRIFFAKTKSDAIAKLDGSYQKRERKLRPKPVQKPKADPVEEDEDLAAPAALSSAPAPGGVPPAAAAGVPGMGGAPPGTAAAGFGAPLPGYGPPPGYGHAPPAAAAAPVLPHPILFLENLPPDASSDDVSSVFAPFPGFKEVRLVPSRPGIGFAEFENEMQSGMALGRVQGQELKGLAMKVTFSKS